jgi:hypothetical protein
MSNLLLEVSRVVINEKWHVFGKPDKYERKSYHFTSLVRVGSKTKGVELPLA